MKSRRVTEEQLDRQLGSQLERKLQLLAKSHERGKIVDRRLLPLVL
jgi:hypothetical protein